MSRDEIRCDIAESDGHWYVTVYRNGAYERRVKFNTQTAAVAFADAQLWAVKG